MKIIKEVKISYWAHHFTTIVSVSLVLVLVGIIALVWMGARNETHRLQENIELSVIMADSVAQERTSDLAAYIADQPYAADVKVVDRAQALENWQKDTGENLEQIFGVNPLSDEISFSVKPDYASAPSISQIKDSLSELPDVEGVAAPDAEMVDAMNSNITTLSAILGIVAAIMILISFVLINNTVHLSIYSKRFTIHTMQLVGATDGFIRRPVILDNMLAGLIAGAIASGLLALAIMATRSSLHLSFSSFVSWDNFALLAAALIATGMALCSLAAWLACSRYLYKDYDQLFK